MSAFRAAELRRALQAGAFKLAYQPIVDLATRQLHHYEVLARFDGDASPISKVLLAERAGLSDELDLAVCNAVIETLLAEDRTAPPCGVAVNLSGHSLEDQAFVEALLPVLARGRTGPDTILIEVTETAEITDLEGVNETLARLRRLGHPVCIDDLAADSTTFRYLQAFDADYAKIDGSFTRAIIIGGVERSILEAMLSLCRERGVPIIAEQVEEEEEARRLQAAGVQYGQGYLFGRPLSPLPGAPDTAAG